MRFPKTYTIPEHGPAALLKKERFGLMRDARTRIQKDDDGVFFVYKGKRYNQSKKGSRLFKLVSKGKRSKSGSKSKRSRSGAKRSKSGKKGSKKSKSGKKGSKRSKSGKKGSKSGKKGSKSGKKGSKRSKSGAKRSKSGKKGSKKSKSGAKRSKSGKKGSKRPKSNRPKSNRPKSGKSSSRSEDGKVYGFKAHIDFLGDQFSRKPSKEDIRREMHKLRRIIRRELKGVATAQRLKNLQVEFDNNDPQFVKVSFSSDDDRNGIQVSIEMLKDFDDDGNYPVRIGGHEYLLRLV